MRLIRSYRSPGFARTLCALVLATLATLSFAQVPGHHSERVNERAARQAMRSQRAQQFEAQREARAAQREQARPMPPPQIAPGPVAPQPQPQPRDGHPGRLSPEERRALRQQINDAGRDVYRGGRP